MKKSTIKRLEIFLEFLLFGVAMGLVEDLLALKLATGEPITWRVVGIVTLVAVPFAVLGELVVDRMNIISEYPDNLQEPVPGTGQRASISVELTQTKSGGTKVNH